MPVRLSQFALCYWIFTRVCGIERTKPVVFSYSSGSLPLTVGHDETTTTEPVQDEHMHEGTKDHVKMASFNNGVVVQNGAVGYQHIPVQGYEQPVVYNGNYYATSAPPMEYNNQEFLLPTTYRPKVGYQAHVVYNNAPLQDHYQHYHQREQEALYPQQVHDYSSHQPPPPDAYYSTTPYYETHSQVSYDYQQTTVPPYNEFNHQNLPPTEVFYEGSPSTSQAPLNDHGYGYNQNPSDYPTTFNNNYNGNSFAPDTTLAPYESGVPLNTSLPPDIPVNGSHGDFDNLSHTENYPTIPPFEYGERTNRIHKDNAISSTSTYGIDNADYVHTTPLIDFESFKENLPAIEDYPPPKRGYITKPFRAHFRMKKNKGKLERTKTGFGDHSKDNKVFQRPRFFAHLNNAPIESVSSVEHDDGDEGGHVDEDADDDSSGEIEDHETRKNDESYAKGGGQKHHSAHKASLGDKGDKGYETSHKYGEGKKGHHDKEGHKGKYLDEKRKKAEEKEEGAHFGEHHKAEKGKKAAKYGESGDHKKGHSTKGEHNIHKVDEYLKKHEFYDEHHEGGDHEKRGGFEQAHARKKGSKKKKGHNRSGRRHKHKGKKGRYEKGKKEGARKGHEDAKGYDTNFARHKMYGKKGASKKGKKWGYSMGHPK